MRPLLYTYLLAAYLTLGFIIWTFITRKIRPEDVEDDDSFTIEFITVAILVFGWPTYWWSLSYSEQEPT